MQTLDRTETKTPSIPNTRPLATRRNYVSIDALVRHGKIIDFPGSRQCACGGRTRVGIPTPDGKVIAACWRCIVGAATAAGWSLTHGLDPKAFIVLFDEFWPFEEKPIKTPRNVDDLLSELRQEMPEDVLCRILALTTDALRRGKHLARDHGITPDTLSKLPPLIEAVMMAHQSLSLNPRVNQTL